MRRGAPPEAEDTRDRDGSEAVVVAAVFRVVAPAVAGAAGRVRVAEAIMEIPRFIPISLACQGIGGWITLPAP
ncbi:hypothetical protein [Streptomyces sp. TRM49041]|uniref:hypothetical protein n=1 Tax=Streptomyces sp. TRM49041 TaxID=2603216 RepID=UPI0021CC77D3|nr:hypothetical protein [Streptomyces sp. TRM49041]